VKTETATEIARAWLGSHGPEVSRLAGRLSALLPEPDVWAVHGEGGPPRLLSLTKRSLFAVSRDGQQLTVGRAIVTEDADTQIGISDGEPDGHGEWSRHWTFRFARKPVDFEDIILDTSCIIGTAPYPSEQLARRIAAVAGWPIGDVTPPARPG
jgi:hypothetical protein